MTVNHTAAFIRNHNCELQWHKTSNLLNRNNLNNNQWNIITGITYKQYIPLKQLRKRPIWKATSTKAWLSHFRNEQLKEA